jgi:hypothetical protein
MVLAVQGPQPSCIVFEALAIVYSVRSTVGLMLEKYVTDVGAKDHACFTPRRT